MSTSTDDDRSERADVERGDAEAVSAKGKANDDFDVAGAIPRQGRIVIEASAGTGKTYTLATLAARLLIERTCTPSELVLVTFTRAAAAEIRGRIRDRLVAIEGDLAQPDTALAHARATRDNDNVSLLYQAQMENRSELLAGVRDAIGGFDAITIGTIHSFCQFVLSMAPTDSATDLRMASGDDGVLDEAVSDALVTASLLLEATGQTPRVVLPVDTAPLWSDFINICETEPVSAAELPSASSLASAAAKVIATPNASVVPDLAPEAGSLKARVSVALCNIVASKVEARRAQLGLLNYDRLQTEAHRLVTTDASVRAVLGARFKAVLIDEFQDTDELQWAIFDQTFADATNTLMVMVGDPKQAIYGFRGGDIHTYLDATGARDPSAPGKWSLRTNFRSSRAVVSGLNELFSGSSFGDSIDYVPVRSKAEAQIEREGPGNNLTVSDASDNEGSDDDRPVNDASATAQFTNGTLGAEGSIGALETGQPRAAVEIRCLDAGEGKPPLLPAARRAVAVDVANTAVDLIQDEGVAPGDICVLVNSHADGRSMLRALRQSRVPAVLARPGLVTQSVAAEQWRRLLSAMARPADVRQARGAMLGWFGGYSVQDLADVEASEVTTWQLTLQRWADISSERGAAAMYRAVRAASGFERDLLSQESGERDATDVAHIAEILHVRSAGRPVSPQVLLDILDAAVLETEDDSDELKGRTEGDAASVQIMTMHAAKGLEFPVTLVPFLWPDFRSSSPRSYSAELSDGRGPKRRRRVVDLEGSALRRPYKADAEKRKGEYTTQQLDEKRRLAYVALTRAKERVVMWWVRTKKNAEASAAGPILFNGNEPADESTEIDPHQAWLQKHRASALISVDGFSIDLTKRRLHPGQTDGASGGFGDGAAGVGDGGAAGGSHGVVSMTAARATHEPTRSDSRWSFTAITRNLAVHGDDVGESPVAGGTDEPEAATPLDRSGIGPTDVLGSASIEPIGETIAGSSSELVFPPQWAGTGFGTFVHALLEHLDFASPDIDGDVVRIIDELAPQVQVDEMLKSASDIERFITGIKRVLHAPLGPDFDAGCLADIARHDRLDELEFDLELPRRGAVAPFALVAERLRAIFAPPHPLAVWADRLAEIGSSLDLGGYLNGSIDLVFRTVSPDGAMKFHVVDYKTNLLGDRAAGYSFADYGPPGLWAGMADHHYPLQALIYGAALHRYLRWRMPHYDPHAHLGSYGYLFVRGMDAAVGQAGHGVCSWPIDAGAVIAVSDLFAGNESPGKAAR